MKKEPEQPLAGPVAPSPAGSRQPFEEDFLRGNERIAEQLTRTLDQSPDVGQPYASQSWETITQLAWRPAWSIRSRRGALEPLLDWWRSRKPRCGSAD